MPAARMKATSRWRDGLMPIERGADLAAADGVEEPAGGAAADEDHDHRQDRQQDGGEHEEVAVVVEVDRPDQRSGHRRRAASPPLTQFCGTMICSNISANARVASAA